MTNQSKHQKIYELTGIEPKMWFGDVVKSENSTISNLFAFNRSFVTGEPHYPCEQLWQMLPTDIDDGNYFLVCNKGALRYESWADSRHEVPNLIDADFENLQTALLDMILWCIDKGYIKSTKQGKSLDLKKESQQNGN